MDINDIVILVMKAIIVFGIIFNGFLIARYAIKTLKTKEGKKA